LPVGGHIFRRDPLGRAIDNDVRLPQQVVQPAGQCQACFGDRGARLSRAGIEFHVLGQEHAGAPVRGYVGDANKGHVRLEADGVGDAFADDSVAVHGHTNLSIHGELPTTVDPYAAVGGRTYLILYNADQAPRLGYFRMAP